MEQVGIASAFHTGPSSRASLLRLQEFIRAALETMSS